MAVSDHSTVDADRFGEILPKSFPAGLQRRLEELLDRQDVGTPLTTSERSEAEGLVEIAEFLSLLRFRIGRGSDVRTPANIESTEKPMPKISQQFADSLPDIYRDILKAIPRFNSQRELGAGIAIQSLYASLDNRYSLSQVRLVCERMAEAGVLELRHEIFVYPTELGTELVRQVAAESFAEAAVPEFPRIPA